MAGIELAPKVRLSTERQALDRERDLVGVEGLEVDERPRNATDCVGPAGDVLRGPGPEPVERCRVQGEVIGEVRGPTLVVGGPSGVGVRVDKTWASRPA